MRCLNKIIAHLSRKYHSEYAPLKGLGIYPKKRSLFF